MFTQIHRMSSYVCVCKYVHGSQSCSHRSIECHLMSCVCKYVHGSQSCSHRSIECHLMSVCVNMFMEVSRVHTDP